MTTTATGRQCNSNRLSDGDLSPKVQINSASFLENELARYLASDAVCISASLSTALSLLVLVCASLRLTICLLPIKQPLLQTEHRPPALEWL
ncbi:hypothetical protein BJX63DRAFT_341993 [Aspergillus granulosus]|uniref:Uncharacterized protein n=1 Tax=Aspergillus granulosus TaxID=176169 RepID=A0ABR4H2U6_9EURO